MHHWYNNINSQLDATITNFIDNYNQLNMFQAKLSPETCWADCNYQSNFLLLHLVVCLYYCNVTQLGTAIGYCYQTRIFNIICSYVLGSAHTSHIKLSYIQWDILFIIMTTQPHMSIYPNFINLKLCEFVKFPMLIFVLFCGQK